MTKKFCDVCEDAAQTTTPVTYLTSLTNIAVIPHAKVVCEVSVKNRAVNGCTPSLDLCKSCLRSSLQQLVTQLNDLLANTSA